MDDQEMKRRDIEAKMIQMEEEYQARQTEMDKKDETIKKLRKQVDSMEKGLQDDSDFVALNLNGLADLEAKLSFMAQEKEEIEKTIAQERAQNEHAVIALKETIEEMQEQVQEARMVQTKLTIYEKRMEELPQFQSKVK